MTAAARSEAKATGPRRLALAVPMLVLALVCAACCLAPATALADGGGEVALGVSVKGAPEQTAQGGSVELSVNVGAQGPAASAGNSVELSINMATKAVHRVSFVGYYCDEEGDVVLNADGSQKKETIEVQAVADGGCATAPDNLARTDADGQEYWVDGWYAYDAAGALVPVDLPTREVTGGATFVCYWKKGYAVRLDPNNGQDAATGATVFDGTVNGGATGTIAVARDVAWEDAHPTVGDPANGNPAGYTAPSFPAAERPGYVFKGWYWGREDEPRDCYGRVALDEVGGLVAEAGDVEGYDFFREHCAGGIPTLYAKWELAPLVRIGLAGATTSEGDAQLWFWPGRGYALAKPAADREAEAGFVIGRADVPASGLDVTDTLGIAYNPSPVYSTQVFSGWGYEVQGEDGKLERVRLVSATKPQGADAFAYVLAPTAFDYANDKLQWTGPAVDDRDPANPGGKKAEWEALFDYARISVTAPFEVVFQQKGATWASDPTDVVAYTADDLEGKRGWTWVESIEQSFYNRSTAGEGASPVKVYVSGIECTDTGAGSLVPSAPGAPDKRVFALYDNGILGGGTGGNAGLAGSGAKSLSFGYASDGGANAVTAPTSRPGEWIVLDPAGADNVPVTLYFGLDLTKVELNRSAIALGGGSSSSDGTVAASRYKAPLANVKYTYSVVP